MSLYLGNTPIADSGNSRANINLSNLTSQGKNIANWSTNVTNCITEIPQNIKLELNNGTLTLKAGSKVYVPNGIGVFDTVTVANDISITYASWGQSCMWVYHTGLNTITSLPVSRCYSGNTAPSGITGSAYWYDTTNNIIKITSDGSTWVYASVSFPFAICTDNGVSVTSIGQVFNGFGYIGSTVFALPNVKGLIPNGRNADSSLKSIEFTTSNVLTWTPSWTGNGTIVLDSAGIYINGSLDEKYDEQTNFTSLNGVIHSFCFCGSCTLNNGVISNFTPKTAFHALDYNDSSTISGWSMPSSRYIDLTLLASGSQYTAPANGKLFLDKIATAQGQYITLVGNSYRSGGTAGIMNEAIIAELDMIKGEKATIYYSTAGTTNFFRFIYAEGENV